MDRILFICSTKLLLFNALHVRMHMFPNAKADIIVDFTKADRLAYSKRLEKTGLFDNVAYLEPEYFGIHQYIRRARKNESSQPLNVALHNTFANYKDVFSHYKDRYELFLKNSINGYENIDIAQYSYVFAQGNNDTVRSIANLIKKKNGKCKICALEEGTGTYYVDYICDDIKPDYIYVFDPDVVLYENNGRIREMPPINRDDKEFLECANLVFDYHKNGEITDKIILFDKYAEDMPNYLKKHRILARTLLRNAYKKHYEESKMFFAQREAFKLLCKYGKDKDIIVKLHPTTKRETITEEFLSYKNVTMAIDNEVPWEVVCLNNIVRQNVIVTLASSAVRSNSIFLFPPDDNKYIILIDAIEFPGKDEHSRLLKRWRKVKNINVIFPQNMNEYANALSKALDV